ncbi:hypothetical protein [Ureibacillus manganicus]|uniref:hypothetical protein n=1 Tax=Ureibacillus manganicus TaxID=1266064 RepID=UPI0006914EC5|nr:hypothetical protein [Ureibacillus manganicus]
MQNYNWDIKTQFVFPEEYGVVEDVVSVDIKPRFQLIETEEALRLVGIYHITSVVQFDPHELPDYSEGTLIEHLELTGNNGYFEYALPLEVNFPKEKVPTGCHPELYIEDVRYDVYDGSSATYNWDVCCTITDPVMEPVNEVDEVIQFESYLESNNIPLEIPSASAFAELIQQPESTNLEVVEVVEEELEPLTLDDQTEKLEPLILEDRTERLEPLILEDQTEELKPLTKHDQVEEVAEVVEVDDAPNYVESVNYVEREQEQLQEINAQTINHVSENEILTEEVAQVLPQEDTIEELVNTENVMQRKDPSDYFFDDDDFLASLSESYTPLDLKSNKVSPE